VWILTVTADGAVPIAFRVADGNTADVTTHIDTWDTLVALTGEVDFLYVADSKLATFDNVAHIHTRGGRFLSVLPASRKEDRVFRDWVVTNTPDWVEIARRPTRDPSIPRTSSRLRGPSALRRRPPDHLDPLHRQGPPRRDPPPPGHRQAIAAIDALNVRLSSPRCRIKTAVGAEAEAREPSPRSTPPAGSTSTSRPTPSRASGRPNEAVPAPTPPTRRSPAPGCGSGSPSTRTRSPTTPPPTGCGR
jgi:hypothetical protein